MFSPRHAAEEIDRTLVFRDWPRVNDADRERHATTKRELSTRDWRYVQDYADAKTEVVRDILARPRLTEFPGRKSHSLGLVLAAPTSRGGPWNP